jgi:hypothetical protein
MFSGRVERVSGTSIYARGAPDGRQVLVYEMSVAAREPVAMVLPLPVPVGTDEGAVRFINLERGPAFFARMRAGFVVPTRSFAAPQGLAFAMLAVHDVGAFEASFVPRVADFARLDPRFRLPQQAWDALPAYADWGFAVFKLKTVSSEPRPVHPMAFEFPRRDPTRLFFPTVHVHDGEVHPRAGFDHALYCQTRAVLSDAVWTRSEGEARLFMEEPAFALGLVDPAASYFERKLAGTLPNEDTWAGDAAAALR